MENEGQRYVVMEKWTVASIKEGNEGSVVLCK